MLLIDLENIYRDQFFIQLNTDVNLSRKVVLTVGKAIFAD